MASRDPWRESLQSIHSNHVASSQALNSLLAFKNLHCVTLCNMVVDDTILGLMAKAWLMLQNFTITHTTPSRSSPCHATLQSLISFSQYYPRINSLCLQLDASHVPPLVNGSDSSRADLGTGTLRPSLSTDQGSGRC